MVETDVLVIGGGPAGAAAAITLARAGRRCVVLENQAAPGWKIGETLAPESRQILQTLGVWDAFTQEGHLASPGNCSAWGGEELVAKDFIFNRHGHAWQLDRTLFESMLLSAATVAGAQICRGASWWNIERRSGGWAVATENETFMAGFLMDASGRGSQVARHGGAVRTIVDKLVSIYAVVASPTETDADARTYIEAVPEGWWYSTLMPGHRRIFAFQTDADLLPGQEWRAANWFRKRLGETRHLRALCESQNYTVNDGPQLTSAHSSRLEECLGDGWLAVGDAAQSYDPISGEGLFHALLTGHHGARCLAANTLPEYVTLNRSLWNRFLLNRCACYALETRWPNQPFWQRRQAAS